MPRRTKEWKLGLAEDLKNPAFLREFISASLDEGISLQAILARVIRAQGVKEFARRAKMTGPSVIRAIHPRHNPTLNTVNRLLRPLGLRLTVAFVERRPVRSAA